MYSEGSSHYTNTISALKKIREFDYLSSEISHFDWKPLQQILFNRRKIDSSFLKQVSDTFQISVDSLLDDKIDFKALEARMCQETFTLPEKYTLCPNSKIKTIQQILNYISPSVNKSHLMKSLQIPFSTLTETNAPVNCLLVHDLFKLIYRKTLNHSIFIELGVNSVISRLDSDFIRMLRDTGSIESSYIYMIENLTSIIEKNSHYKIHSNDGQTLIVHSSDNTETKEQLKIKSVATHEGCYYRLGFFTAFPAIFGLPLAKVTKNKCILKGDSFCSFEIDISMYSKQTLKIVSLHPNHAARTAI
tara:strand:+ start:4528 stop:5439 length:912 start_codon:yes stop_codon:yes gene_type:complete